MHSLFDDHQNNCRIKLSCRDLTIRAVSGLLPVSVMRCIVFESFGSSLSCFTEVGVPTIGTDYHAAQEIEAVRSLSSSLAAKC